MTRLEPEVSLRRAGQSAVCNLQSRMPADGRGCQMGGRVSLVGTEESFNVHRRWNELTMYDATMYDPVGRAVSARMSRSLPEWVPVFGSFRMPLDALRIRNWGSVPINPKPEFAKEVWPKPRTCLEVGHEVGLEASPEVWPELRREHWPELRHEPSSGRVCSEDSYNVHR
jgi:hypothetical protein